MRKILPISILLDHKAGDVWRLYFALEDAGIGSSDIHKN